MTVAEYITHLQQFPPDFEVMRTWDELGSFHPARPPELLSITQHQMFKDDLHWFEKGDFSDDPIGPLDEKQIVKVGSP